MFYVRRMRKLHCLRGRVSKDRHAATGAHAETIALHQETIPMAAASEQPGHDEPYL